MTITKRLQKIWMLVRKVVETDWGWPTGQQINEPGIWGPEESITYKNVEAGGILSLIIWVRRYCQTGLS